MPARWHRCDLRSTSAAARENGHLFEGYERVDRLLIALQLTVDVGDVDDQAESAALVFERRLPVRELISHRFPLEQIAEALELAARPSDNTLKVVIRHE